MARLSLNSLWIFVSRLGTQLGLALFTILLARGLGSRVFGEYAFMASVIVIGNVLTTFGTDMLLIREIAITDNLGGLSPALIIQLMLSGGFVGIVVLSSSLMPLEGMAASALRIYSLSMFPLAFYTVFTTALRGRQRMLAYAGLNLALIAMQILGTLWLLSRRGNLLGLALLLLSVQTAAAIFAGILCATHFPDFRQVWRFSWRTIQPLVKASAPIALLGLLGVLYQRIILLLLPPLAGASVTGWFSAAARFVEAAKIGQIAVLTALYPSMAQVLGAAGSARSRVLRIPALALLAGACVLSLALYFLAGTFITILFGTQYLSSIPLVRILAWMLVPYCVNSFLTLAFLARGATRSLAGTLALSTLVLVVLTVWWVPLAGAAGAAWAALAAEALQAGLLLAIDLRSTHTLGMSFGL